MSAHDPHIGPPIRTGISSHLLSDADELPAGRPCLPPPPSDPAPLTLPEACRAAVRLLDAYDVARTTVLACATEKACAPEALKEIRGLHGKIAVLLDVVADALPEGDASYAVWVARSAAAEAGVIDEAWAVELAAVAERDTDPEASHVG